MNIASDYIWFDGELVPYADATVHVLSHTLHYGLGVFEGIRAYEQPDGEAGVWCLDEHLQRLLDSLKMMRLTIPYSLEELRAACMQTLKANGFVEAYLRPLAFMGTGALGLGAKNKVHVVIAAWIWGAYLGEAALEQGVDIKCSTYVRHHPNAALQRAKVVGHYVNNILARYEANDDGFDEALMLDYHGYVAEGTGENVFVAKGTTVKTPPAVNILPGITRRTVIDILEHAGHRVLETNFGRDTFYVAHEAWMCGTAAEITPIRSCDRRTVGAGEPGPLTRLVQRTYVDGVRGRVDWLADRITR